MSYHLGFVHECLEPKALQIAKHYGFIIDQHHYPRLQLEMEGLFYSISPKDKISMDWNDIKLARRAHGALGQDPLIRACLAKKNSPSILDLTAGWGKDAMLLARAGARVTLLEKHPAMVALLKDAHERLQDKDLQSRISIYWIDAHDYLMNLSEKDYPDVIYLDPMHPTRQKTALVKKHLQILQTLAKPNTDVEALINLAKTKCHERLVLKWPAKGLKFKNTKGSLVGKTIRFDIF